MIRSLFNTGTSISRSTLSSIIGSSSRYYFTSNIILLQKNRDRFINDLKNDDSEINKIINKNNQNTDIPSSKGSNQSSKDIKFKPRDDNHHQFKSRDNNQFKPRDDNNQFKSRDRQFKSRDDNHQFKSTSSSSSSIRNEKLIFRTPTSMDKKIDIDKTRKAKEEQKEEREKLKEAKRISNPNLYKEIAPGIAINPSLSKVNRTNIVVSSSGSSPELINKGKELAALFDVDYMEWPKVEKIPLDLCTYQLCLFIQPSGELVLNNLEIQPTKRSFKRKMTAPISLDFTSGELEFKTRSKTYQSSPLVRSVRCPDVPKTVLDITGGLCKDAWIIAGFGSHVTVLERNPILAYLIERALEKARDNPETKEIADRITFIKCDSIEYLVNNINRNASEQPDVIYMDPMYQSREKEEKNKSLSKKDIRAIRKLVGGDRESQLLFALSKRIAQKRIVWKKPKHVAPAPGVNTFFKSRETRFEVYFFNQQEQEQAKEEIKQHDELHQIKKEKRDIKKRATRELKKAERKKRKALVIGLYNLGKDKVKDNQLNNDHNDDDHHDDDNDEDDEEYDDEYDEDEEYDDDEEIDQDVDEKEEEELHTKRN